MLKCEPSHVTFRLKTLWRLRFSQRKSQSLYSGLTRPCTIQAASHHPDSVTSDPPPTTVTRLQPNWLLCSSNSRHAPPQGLCVGCSLFLELSSSRHGMHGSLNLQVWFPSHPSDHCTPSSHCTFQHLHTPSSDMLENRAVQQNCSVSRIWT